MRPGPFPRPIRNLSDLRAILTELYSPRAYHPSEDLSFPDLMWEQGNIHLAQRIISSIDAAGDLGAALEKIDLEDRKAVI